MDISKFKGNTDNLIITKDNVVIKVAEETPGKAQKDSVRRKIIYVDDVAHSLLTVRDSLKRHYEVYPAQTADKMYELLGSIRPDLILLDINMPDHDGFDILQSLKQDQRYHDIPVIFLTANNDKKSIIRGMSLGASDMIFKPFTAEDVITHIEYQFDSEAKEKNKPVILAVDDSPGILTAINHALNVDYTVRTLNDPELFKELLSAITPDLFLLDYNMPSISGFDLVPIIRATPGHEKTPIVFLTSEASIDHVSVALGLGACDYIIKPIDEDNLRARVKTHISGYMTNRLIRSIETEKTTRIIKRGTI